MHTVPDSQDNPTRQKQSNKLTISVCSITCTSSSMPSSSTSVLKAVFSILRIAGSILDVVSTVSLLGGNEPRRVKACVIGSVEQNYQTGPSNGITCPYLHSEHVRM